MLNSGVNIVKFSSVLDKILLLLLFFFLNHIAEHALTSLVGQLVCEYIDVCAVRV